MADVELIRLVDAARVTTDGVRLDVDAVRLYRDAALVAEQRIDDPLGTAVAGVLAMAAERRRVAGVAGAVGEHRTMLALALRVLELRPEDGPRA